MRLWIILPEEPITDDRAYLVGCLKGVFDRVMVSRAERLGPHVPDPPERPDVILNLVSSWHTGFLDELDAKAARWGVPVSPPSRGAWRTEDKRTYLEDFPDVSPPSRIVRSTEALEAVRAEFGGDVVVKDPFGHRGKAVERIRRPQDLPLADAMLRATIRDTRELIVQPFFEGFSAGDKRVMLQRTPEDGFEIIGYFERRPPEGGWKSNIRAGGRSFPTTLSDDERALALSLAPRTGIDHVGFDIASHDGRLWYIEHNQGYGGIIDYDLDSDGACARKAAAFLLHIARHGRNAPPKRMPAAGVLT